MSLHIDIPHAHKLAAEHTGTTSIMILAIKTLREHLGLGLREAKQIWDGYTNGHIDDRHGPVICHELSVALRALGLKVEFTEPKAPVAADMQDMLEVLKLQQNPSPAVLVGLMGLMAERIVQLEKDLKTAQNTIKRIDAGF